MKLKPNYVIAATILLVLLAGEFIIYVDNPYEANASLRLEGDSMYLDLETSYSTDYTVLATHSEVYDEPRNLYIYRDPSYPSEVLDSYIDHTIECLITEFQVYNFDRYTILNAEGMRDMMVGSTVVGMADRTAVMIFSGILPDTVYGDNTVLLDWLAAGGSLYWTGGALGEYVGHQKGTTDHEVDLVTEDPGMVFFGVPGSIGTNPDTVRASDFADDRELGIALNVYCDNCNYGLTTDIPESLHIGYVLDGYSSIGIAKVGDGIGQVCVFGGKFPASDLQTGHSNVFKVFLSGLSYDSEIVLLESSQKSSGTIEVDLGYFKNINHIYVACGSVLGTYGIEFYPLYTEGEGWNKWM